VKAKTEHRNSSRGFTLLEVLVVLVVVSLISVVLMQGLSLVLNLRNSFGGLILDMDREVVKRSLMRQPIAGLVPDYDDGLDIFQGRADELRGLTLQPLLRRSGRPTPFSMTLSYDTSNKTNSLVYREIEDEPVVLAEWTGEQARFQFMGLQPGWLNAWPPVDPNGFAVTQVITDAKPPQLPELVYLDTQSFQEPVLAVAMGSRRNRTPRDPPNFGGASP
jgi:general secretion pathway protein J